MSLESPSVACGSTVSTTIGDDEREEESDATNLSRDKMVPQQVQMNPAPTVAFIEHHHSHILYISKHDVTYQLFSETRRAHRTGEGWTQWMITIT